jgi:manganese oxidase
MRWRSVVVPALVPAAVLLSGCTGSSSAGHDDHVSGSSATASGGVLRSYFIAADEVRWNYAPVGMDRITGKPFGEAANIFVKHTRNRIGSTYTKCIYRGYTDNTFGARQPRAKADAYLGLLGPVIHAEVGDTIRVVFKNNCSFRTSVHPHGVFYDKDGEGAPYDDGTSGGDKADDAVRPGGTHIYLWKVPERAGPGPMDGSSVMWMYHSHTNEIEDTYSGLMGPMVVTAAGKAREDGSPMDVDCELFYLFAVMNENQSHYLAHDAEDLTEPPHDIEGDEEFNESNLMHSMNGYVFGNGPIPVINKGEHVRWYVMGMGTEVDLHTPHWHGNTVTVNGMRMDTVNLLPASMVTADMTPDDPGDWLFHCHVNDHIAAGMQALYRVNA